MKCTRRSTVTDNCNIRDLVTSRYQVDAAPRKVLLFSGHMIDAPGRRQARFPANKEPIAADAIAKALVQIDSGPRDLAICGGGGGGGFLFSESFPARRARLEIYICLLQ